LKGCTLKKNIILWVHAQIKHYFVGGQETTSTGRCPVSDRETVLCEAETLHPSLAICRNRPNSSPPQPHPRHSLSGSPDSASPIGGGGLGGGGIGGGGGGLGGGLGGGAWNVITLMECDSEPYSNLKIVFCPGVSGAHAFIRR